KPYIIIDEYDNLFMNSAGTSGFEDFRGWLRNVLSSALKGNEFLEKAVLTGVNRIAQESLFSGLNNVTVYDVFTPSKFDTDFGLTEEEVAQLFPDIEERGKVREWYNGFRVGNSEVYNIYSVTSYLAFHEFDNYWGLSGAMTELKTLMSEDDYYSINQILEEGSGIFPVQPRLSAEDILSKSPSAFWGLAVQTGYLSHKSHIQRGLGYLCELYIPNAELRDIWKWFILQHIFDGYDNSITKALDNIRDSAILAELLGDFLITKLSYYDIYKDNYENNYHNLLLGMLSFRGFETISNRESGMGRYDLLVKMPKYYIIFELKVAKEEHLMESAADDALKQIDERKYWAGLGTNLPVYKVGIAFYNKQCVVKSVLHERG
ncbi:MAG: ATP-binding protein, partial [Clostridiales bacterium]|nr:ATP-binding protein [Clostridiales bacterium]